MGEQSKYPIKIKEIEIKDLFKLKNIGENTGVMDMWIKKCYSDSIVISKELECIKDILIEAYNFESYVNPDIKSWNMWLLIDIRPVKKYHSQRNCGYHFDGLAISKIT
jgi:hypothetical protein